MVVDLNPSGVGYTEDFHRADSVPALLALLAEDRHLLLDALIITRARLATSYRAAQKPPPHLLQSIIRSLSNPLYTHSTLVVLKASATSPALFTHRRAVVFTSPSDVTARIA